MSEWPRVQDYNRITISTDGPDSCGAELAAMGSAPASTVWPAANRAIFVPIVVSTTITVLKLGWLNGATVTGNVDVGLYDSQQNRLISAGSTAQSGVSAVQTVDTTDTVVRPGVYYLALTSSSASATFYRLSAAVPLSSVCGALSMETALPLPNPAVFATKVDGAVPIIFLTARTVI